MKFSFWIAVLISLIAIVWVASGQIGLSAKTDQPAVVENAESTDTRPSVQIMLSKAALLQDSLEVTGRTSASRRVMIAAETTGQVAGLGQEKGAFVQKGAVVARLAIKERAAKVEEMRQLVKQRELQFQAAKELTDQGFSSRVRLAEATAQLDAARAQLKQEQITLDQTVIRAPFDGVLNQQMVELGDYVSTGTVLFELVDLDPMEVQAYVTEKQVGRLQDGIPVSAHFIDGQDATGTLSFIASAADPQTRTFLVEISFENPQAAIKDGLTAQLKIPTRERLAHNIPSSVLTLNEKGTVGVKIVDAQDQVQFVPVEILKDMATSLWVDGLPEEVRLITVGQDFVTAGQAVEAVLP